MSRVGFEFRQVHWCATCQRELNDVVASVNECRRHDYWKEDAGPCCVMQGQVPHPPLRRPDAWEPEPDI